MQIIKLFQLKPIFFPVRYPKDGDLKDGYFQRVLAVDDIFKKAGFSCVYIAKSEKFSFLLKLKKINNESWEIVISGKNPFQLLVVFFFGIFSRAVYLHGIMRIKTPVDLLMFYFARKSIIDLHGAVPEELFLYGKKRKSKIFDKIEMLIVKRADIVISVTGLMINHIQKKHNLRNKTFIQLPIFSQKKGDFAKKVFSQKVIYCGGLQKWQKFEDMLSYVNRFKDKYEFTFLVPNPKELENNYLDSFGEGFPGFVRSVSPDEVGGWYAKNNFGLVLRDDIVVNNVACPTKLIEYLQYDLIPIVDTENIGDFKKMGYQFVHKGDKLPDEAAWNEMIIKNQKVLEELNKLSKHGAEMLVKGMR